MDKKKSAKKLLAPYVSPRQKMAKERLRDLAVPTMDGLKRSVLRDAKEKRRRIADEKWSADRRAKPSSGLGVGY